MSIADVPISLIASKVGNDSYIEGVPVPSLREAMRARYAAGHGWSNEKLHGGSDYYLDWLKTEIVQNGYLPTSPKTIQGERSGDRHHIWLSPTRVVDGHHRAAVLYELAYVDKVFSPDTLVRVELHDY